MAKRKSVNTQQLRHKNPIPAASRIGDLLVSSVINGVDPATGKIAATLEEQCAHMFGHVRRIVEAGGGTTDDIIKITVWMKDRSQRDALNHEWIKMFPDEQARPARHTIQGDLDGDILIQCDFMAVLDKPA